MGCGCGKKSSAAKAASLAAPISLTSCDDENTYDGPLNSKRIWIAGWGTPLEKLFSQRQIVAASSYSREHVLPLRAVYCSQVCTAAVEAVYAALVN